MNESSGRHSRPGTPRSSGGTALLESPLGTPRASEGGTPRSSACGTPRSSEGGTPRFSEGTSLLEPWEENDVVASLPDPASATIGGMKIERRNSGDEKSPTSKGKQPMPQFRSGSLSGVELGDALIYQDGTVHSCSDGWNTVFTKCMEGDHLLSLVFPSDYKHVVARLQLVEAANSTTEVGVRFGRVVDNSLFKVALAVWPSTEPNAAARLVLHGPVVECGLVKDALDRLHKRSAQHNQKRLGVGRSDRASTSHRSHRRQPAPVPEVPEGSESDGASSSHQSAAGERRSLRSSRSSRSEKPPPDTAECQSADSAAAVIPRPPGPDAPLADPESTTPSTTPRRIHGGQQHIAWESPASSSTCTPVAPPARSSNATCSSEEPEALQLPIISKPNKSERRTRRPEASNYRSNEELQTPDPIVTPQEPDKPRPQSAGHLGRVRRVYSKENMVSMVSGSNAEEQEEQNDQENPDSNKSDIQQKHHDKRPYAAGDQPVPIPIDSGQKKAGYANQAGEAAHGSAHAAANDKNEESANDKMNSLSALSRCLHERILRHVTAPDREAAIHRVALALVELSKCTSPWAPFRGWKCLNCNATHEVTDLICCICDQPGPNAVIKSKVGESEVT